MPIDGAEKNYMSMTALGSPVIFSPDDVNSERLRQIECAIVAYPLIEAACVVQLSKAVGPALAAYYTTEDDCEVGDGPLMGHISQKFPEITQTIKFERLSTLPMGADGKVDRAALEGGGFASPAPLVEIRPVPTEFQERVIEMVRQTVGATDVSLDDNFFDVGGHSLLGTQLVMRVRRTFGARITLRDVFEADTVADLAGRIEELLLMEIAELSDEDALRLSGGGSPLHERG